MIGYFIKLEARGTCRHLRAISQPGGERKLSPRKVTRIKCSVDSRGLAINYNFNRSSNSDDVKPLNTAFHGVDRASEYYFWGFLSPRDK